MFNRNTGVSHHPRFGFDFPKTDGRPFEIYTSYAPWARPTIFVIFVPETDTCASNESSSTVGVVGHVAWGATSLMKNVGWFLERRGRNGNMQTSNGVAVVRDGYWTRAANSTLRAEF